MQYTISYHSDRQLSLQLSPGEMIMSKTIVSLLVIAVCNPDCSNNLCVPDHTEQCRNVTKKYTDVKYNCTCNPGFHGPRCESGE